jgi:hypothetical protein
MIASPFVMELIPGFGRPELTGTYFGIFYAVSGVAAALGNTVVGWAMDTGEGTGAEWLPWVFCAVFGPASAAGVAWLHRRGALPAGRGADPAGPADLTAPADLTGSPAQAASGASATTTSAASTSTSCAASNSASTSSASSCSTASADERSNA